MTHTLTADQTADEIEAAGLDLRAHRKPGTTVKPGDGCVITSADGCTFIGDVTEAAPHTTSVRVRLR